MHRKLKRILWGIVLVAGGVLWGLNALHLLPFSLFFKGWWTLFIILPGIIGLLTDRNKRGACFALLFGVFLLLCAWDILSFSLLWKLALPVIAVLVGLSLLFGKKHKKGVKQIPPQQGSFADNARCGVIFSAQELRYDGKPFCGADVSAVFGNVDVLAANAIITADCTLYATAVFGNVEICLPDHVNVEVTSDGVFGNVENQRCSSAVAGAPTVYVRATTKFGNVEIQ